MRSGEMEKHGVSCLLLIALLLGNAGRALGDPAKSTLDAAGSANRRHEQGQRLRARRFFPANGQGGGSGVVISPRLRSDQFPRRSALRQGDAMRHGRPPKCTTPLWSASILPATWPSLSCSDATNFPCAQLGDTDKTRVGRLGLCHGQPLPVWPSIFSPRSPTESSPACIAPSLRPTPNCICWSTPTACKPTLRSIPATRAAPCSDADGRLIGINGRASFEKRGRVNVGAAYAISINQIKNFLGTLRGGRIADHATLGAEVQSDEGAAPW